MVGDRGIGFRRLQTRNPLNADSLPSTIGQAMALIAGLSAAIGTPRVDDVGGNSRVPYGTEGTPDP